MKPISRFLALFAVLALCATAFSACKKEGGTDVSDVSAVPTAAPTNAEGLTEADRAFALYETALETHQAATGHSASLSGTATVKSAGETTEWTLDLAWISEQPSKNTVDFKDHLTETLVKNNEVTERDVYYGKGVMYASQNGQKFRQIIDRKTAIGETALFTLPTMTKAAFASPLIVQEKGNTVISLPMNGDILSEELLAEDGALAYLLGGIDPEATYDFGNVTASVSIDEGGYLVGFSVYYTVTADNEQQTTATVTLSLAYDRVDSDITVKLPAANKYKERIGSGLTKAAYAVMTDVVDLLYGADGERVEDFDTAYETACKQYKKSLVDEIIEWFEEQ